jgi:hypothetical protein
MTVLTIRAHKRYAVRQPVLLGKPGAKPVGGLMIELSSEGVRISNLGRPGFEIGESVTVEIEDRKFHGRIRWCHNGIAGVRLDTALYSNQLGELVALGRGECPAPDVRRYGT